MQIETLKNTLGYVLSKKEEGKEIYESWHAYFSEYEAFNQFKARYNQHGNVCGCLVYEAHDRVKYRILRKDGAVRMVDDIGRKVFTENRGSVFYVCIVDVTDSVEKN